MIYRVYFLMRSFPEGFQRRYKDFSNGRKALSFAKDIVSSYDSVLAYLEFIDKKGKHEK